MQGKLEEIPDEERQRTVILTRNRKQNASREWIQITTNLSNSSWRFPLIVLDDVKEVENTKAKYFLSILEEIPESTRVIALLTFLSQPMFESYYKSVNKEHFIKMLVNDRFSIKQQMENIYGKCNTKAKNFLGYIGFNKQQLKALEGKEYFCEHVKEIFGSSNVASIDIKTFNNVLDVLSVYKNGAFSNYWLHTAVETLKLLAKRGIPTLNAMKDSLIAISNIGRINGHDEIIGLYKDYLHMTSLMPDIHFKPQFDVKNAKEEITRMHDIVTQVYNTKKFEYQREMFIKAVGRVHKYEYKNSDYSVISPVEPEDLANEGLKLCHCVKSYINKVTEGETNVMFIRKNTEPDEPFFTVEISNGGTIEQIHGLRNRNLSTEPDLIPFVKEWVKAVKIKEGNFDKVR